MLQRFVYIAVILSLVFTASMASADTVWLTETGVANAVTVSIHAGTLGNLSALAGNYLLAIQNPLGSTSMQFSGFCVDPAFAPTSFQPYELVPIAEESRYEAAAWVLSQGNAFNAAAAQVAVWELTWDTPFNLHDGIFQLNGGVNEADVTAIYYAALAGMGASFDQSAFVLARNPIGDPTILGAGEQDYIIKSPAVPIPPTALLLGSGLLGLVGLGWRRSRKEGSS